MNTISGARLAGFIVLALAIVVGTLGFGFAVSSCQPGQTAEPSPTAAAPSLPPTPAHSPTAPSPSAVPSAMPVRSLPPASPWRPEATGAAPRRSDDPQPGGTIPPIVPIPSGPVP